MCRCERFPDVRFSARFQPAVPSAPLKQPNGHRQNQLCEGIFFQFKQSHTKSSQSRNFIGSNNHGHHTVKHRCSARAKRTLFLAKTALYYVNALHVFLGSNLSFNW